MGERERIIQLLVDSQQVIASDVWQWNGSEYQISLGNIISIISEEQ